MKDMRSRWGALTLFLTIAWPVTGFSHGHCRDYFTDARTLWQQVLPDRRVRDVLTPGLSRKIFSTLKTHVERIAGDETLSPQKKHHKGFEVYMALRLEGLPHQDRMRIRDFMDRRMSVVVHTRPELSRSRILDGFYNGATINITLPKTIAGSVLDYAIRVHELEHAIQDLTPDKIQRGMLHPLHFKELFEREMGAIVAESYLLLTAPKAELQNLLEAVKTSGISKQDREIITGFLEDAIQTSTPETYLRAQWKRGRYSRLSFMRKQLDYYIGAGLLVGLGYWGTGAVFGF